MYDRGSLLTLGERTMIRAFQAVLFIILAASAAIGPAGHVEPRGSIYVAPFAILLAGVIVLKGKWPRLHAHLGWACVTFVVFLVSYRFYCYERTNSELYRSKLTADRSSSNP